MSRGWRWVAVLAALGLPFANVSAQDTTMVVDAVTDTTIAGLPRPDGLAYHASPLLPAQHWAVRAAWRAEELGLARFFPAQRNVPRAEVYAALLQAAVNAAGGRYAELTAGWQRRFQEEFPEYAGEPAASGITPLGGWIGGGAVGRRGQVAASIKRQPGPALPDFDSPLGAGEAGLAAGMRAFAWAAPRVHENTATFSRWNVGAEGLGIAASFGREAAGYGFGESGGVVFSGTEPLLRLDLATERPFRLPSFLRVLGPTTLHTYFTRFDEPGRHPGKTYLWGARMAIQPHPRFTLAVNRGTMFGGTEKVSLKRLARSLVGELTNFENQIVSGDLRWRLPTDRAIPLTTYVEWGADDGAGALVEQPGIVAGLYAPAVPGLPQAGVGVEWTRIAPCCGHGSFYFNQILTGEWASHDVALGHPLGGGGHEIRVYSDAALAGAALRLTAAGFVRDRNDLDELDRLGNLYAPLHVGASHGGALDLRWRFLPRSEAAASALVDQGHGWRESHYEVTLRYLF